MSVDDVPSMICSLRVALAPVPIAVEPRKPSTIAPLPKACELLPVTRALYPTAVA